MFETLRQSLKVGVVTTTYPKTPPEVSSRARGKPEIDWANWKDARPAAKICPTGAISYEDANDQRVAQLDLGKCIFCGLCADVDPAIRMTNVCELAASRKDDLRTAATYDLNPDGTHRTPQRSLQLGLQSPADSAAKQRDLLPLPTTKERGEGRGEGLPSVVRPAVCSVAASALSTPSTPSVVGRVCPSAPDLESVGGQIKDRIAKVLGRSLHIREVDAGSCNGCEIEIVGLNSPIYDIERFGIHFVASPRHADMLLVTGPVTRNMELALRKTYDAMPDPRLVVAIGACGCSGGIFGQNYATCGGVDSVLPVDVYIPGCPPNPHALLHGILKAIGRLQV